MSYSVCRVQWEQAEPLLRNIRERVFICERRIPKRVEFDRNDRKAYHMLVCDDSSQEPIATGRIMPTGEISRIAVLNGYRHNFLERLVIRGLLTIAKELELEEIYIKSHLDSVAYFRSHQFHPVGAVYMEAGIPKQKMACSINNFGDTQLFLNH